MSSFSSPFHPLPYTNSFNHCSENYEKYAKSPKRAKDGKLCYSVKNKPLITRDAELEVSESFGFPALHIFLGIVNKLCDALESRWPEFHVWPTKLGVTKEEYHGKTFEVRVQPVCHYHLLTRM